MHTVRDVCCALETLIGTAYYNRLALSSCGEAGVSKTARVALGVA
jgi:hypothetical protein